MERPRLRIAWLYPEYTSRYGDRGNIIVLVQRARWRGLEPEVVQVGLGQRADFHQFDLVHFGGGQDRELEIVAEDFLKVKGSSLGEAIREGLPVLAVCGGFQMLGSHFRTPEGETLRCSGILDLWTESSDQRMTGNVIIESDLWGKPRTVVGFENHSGRTYLGRGLKPLGRVLRGHGNNSRDRMEGVVFKNCVGTYLHGPVLPKNPHLADWLLMRAVQRRYGDQVPFPPVNDELEERAHRAILQRFGPH
ncbi:MAG TPA: glutamine amidotransferase [Symbiobacteriaceae bacterium]